MRLNQQTFQMVELNGLTDRLKEHPKNPKRGDTAAIGESIEVNGFFGAILAQESSGYILAGNHTYRTAVRKGAKEVPVLWIDVDDESALRILLADNKIAELGYIDEEALQGVLDELPDLAGTGYSHVEEAIEANEESPAESAGAGDGVPEPEDIPDDEFESQFGVVLLCEGAEHQQEVYELLQAIGEEQNMVVEVVREVLGRVQLRVVAI